LTRATGIFDLRERPHHAAAVAERIWNAFWRHKGTELAKARDWRELEDQVGEHRLVLYARELGAVPSPPQEEPPWT